MRAIQLGKCVVAVRLNTKRKENMVADTERLLLGKSRTDS